MTVEPDISEPVEDPDLDPDLDPAAREDIEADDERSDEDRDELEQQVRASLAEAFPFIGEPGAPDIFRRTRETIRRIEEDQGSTELVVMGEGVLDAAETSEVTMAESGSADIRYNTSRPEWMQSDHGVRWHRNRTLLTAVRAVAAFVIFGGAGGLAYVVYRALVSGRYKPDSPYRLPKVEADKIDAAWRQVPDSQFFRHVASCVKARGLHLPMQKHLAFELARAFPEHGAPTYADGQIRALAQSVNARLDALRAAGDANATVFDVLAGTQLTGVTVDARTVPLRRNQALTIAEIALLLRIDPEVFGG